MSRSNTWWWDSVPGPVVPRLRSTREAFSPKAACLPCGIQLLPEVTAADIGGVDTLEGGKDEDLIYGQLGNDIYIFAGNTTDVTTVEVNVLIGGQTFIEETQWKLVDGVYTWFTDCGEVQAVG